MYMNITEMLIKHARTWIGKTFDEIKYDIPEPICGKWNDGGKVITFTADGAAAIIYFIGEICNLVEVFEQRETVFE